MWNPELETKYLQIVIEAAKQQVATLSQAGLLAFDPQGSVMVDVKQTDIADALASNMAFSTTEGIAFLAKKTPTTTISLDINHEEKPSKQFLEKVCDITAIREQLKQLPKGSINPIYRELYFHLHATKRVYEKLFEHCDKKPSEAELESALTHTLVIINAKVMDEYKKAIEAAHPLTVDSIQSINQHLDKSRKKILAEAHSEFLTHSGATFTKDQIKALKHLAEETTATSNDIVYVGPHQVTWAAGNDRSSHDRKFGKNIGHQETITHNYNGTTVSANKNPHFHMRVASFAVKTDKRLKWPDEWYINDVKTKLTQLKETENLVNVCDSLILNNKTHTIPRAIVYNLYTALNSRMNKLNTLFHMRPIDYKDEKSNQQSESAEFILKGAHAYNKTQLDKNGVFCLVQNISVNGYGYPLGYENNDPLVREATLMTEMALTHTLYNRTEAPVWADEIFIQYAQFLIDNEDPDLFFSQTEFGKKAIGLLTSSKELMRDYQTNVQNPDKKNVQRFVGEDVLSNAKNSLFNLMNNNRHFRNDATLFQALSLFIEKVSMAGCKSAIDRTPMINNRVAMLERAFNEANSQNKDIRALQEALEKVANATPLTILAAEKILEMALNTAVNNLGLQTQASMQTNAEIGGAAKYTAKSNFINVNTNAAEHAAMSNVAQEHTTQIHRTLAKGIEKAIEKSKNQPMQTNREFAKNTVSGNHPASAATLKPFSQVKPDSFPVSPDDFKKRITTHMPDWNPMITQALNHNGYVVKTTEDALEEIEVFSTGKVTASHVSTETNDDQRKQRAKEIVATYMAVNKPPALVNLRCHDDPHMYHLLCELLVTHKFSLTPSQYNASLGDILEESPLIPKSL